MSAKINSVLRADPIECKANANDQYFTKLTFQIQFVQGLFIADHFLVISQLETTKIQTYQNKIKNTKIQNYQNTKLPPKKTTTFSDRQHHQYYQVYHHVGHLKMASPKLLCFNQCDFQWLEMALSFLLNSLYKDGFVNFSDSTLNFFSDIGDVALLIKY